MKKKALAISVTCIAAIALLGGTYAAISTTSNPITKEVSTSKLGIKIDQNADEAKEIVSKDDNSIIYGAVSGGETINSPVTIENTEDKDCYIRVTIYREWLDENGKLADFEKADPKEIDLLKIDETKTQQSLSGGTVDANWIYQEPEDDPEVVYAYYKTPVNSGGVTDRVFDSVKALKNSKTTNSNSYTGLQIQLTFDADAIQTTAAADAMTAEWGIIPIFNGTTLTSVREQ